MTTRIVPPVDHAAKLTDFDALLLGFAERYPAGAEGDRMRRLGRQAGYPAGCVEFYVALIPIVWRGVSPELDAWWQAAPGHGYVRCPRCSVCEVAELRGRQTVCSAACRRERSRRRAAERRQARDREIAALLQTALQKLKEGPP